MKINLWQYLLISFVVMWTLGDILGFDYPSKMGSSVVVVMILAYINDAHGSLKRMIRK